MLYYKSKVPGSETAADESQSSTIYNPLNKAEMFPDNITPRIFFCTYPSLASSLVLSLPP